MTIRHIRAAAIAAISLSLSGCMAFFAGGTQHTTSSSLVDYLYPDGARPEESTDVVPKLELPLRVGIAFVPTTEDMRWRQEYTLSETGRMELLEKVRGAFEGVDYIQDIEIIPTTYLGSAGGFQALQQTSRLYDLDVFALVSWDQVVTTNDTPLSLLYWTIVGGYVIPASRNSVNTMLDTAVFDVRTRKLLLRAPGFDHSTNQVTAIAANEGRQKIGARSFALAAETMTENLNAEIKEFGERVKKDKSVQIAYSEGYKGSSASAALLLVLALTAVLVPRRIRRKRPIG